MIESNEGLYQRHRPKRLEDVVGQPEAVKTIQGWIKGKGIPHAILLSGDSGCGKSSLAFILRDVLKCSKMDFVKLNCADTRGIDAIREIQALCPLYPMKGPCRIWFLEECHQLTNPAQSNLLDVLEFPPKHVWFILATTDPQKLLPTIRTRCADVKVRFIAQNDMRLLLQSIAKKENVKLSGEVLAKIVEVADGSARKSLVLLEQVAGVENEDDRISIVLRSDLGNVRKSLVKALLKKESWKEISKILKGIRGENPESIRRGILEYATSIVLNGSADQQKAIELLDAFSGNTYDNGFPGLVLACGRFLFGN